MVTISGLSGERDRAQLILVGAVAIAFIVMGLVVVFNTVLYTENVASTGSVSEPQEAQEFARTMLVESARLVERVNAMEPHATPDAVNESLTSNFTKYNTGVRNVSAAAAPVFVNVTDVRSAKRTFAGRASQVDGSTLESAATNRNWSVTSAGQGTVVREFDLAVDANSLAGESGTEAFRLVWQDEAADDNYTVWIYEDDSTGNVAIRTLSDDDTDAPAEDFGSASDECVIDGSSGETVRFNLSEGSIMGETKCSSELDVSDGIPDGELRTVSFVRGDNAAGNYSLVAYRDSAVGPSSYIDSTALNKASVSTSSPRWSYAAWEVTIEVSYQSTRASFTDSYVIEVYNRSR
jgi:hypothetical protein